MRSAIATCLGQGIQLSDLKFQNNQHGKPLLDCSALPRRARAIDFNLTNTDGLLGVAVAAGLRVGVDCERLDRQVRFSPDRIALRFFSPGEREQLLGVEEAERTHSFLRQWTLKEAHVKASGLGLAAGHTREFTILRKGESDNSKLEPAENFAGVAIRGAAAKLELSSDAECYADKAFSYFQCQPSAEHVGSICVQADRGRGDSICAAWADNSLSMFSGFPGYPEELELADSQVLALS